MQDLMIPMRAIDDTLKGTAIEEWMQRVLVAVEKIGRSWRKSADYVRHFKEAGFVDVVEKHFQWPMNPWPKGDRMKLLGSYWLEDMSKGVEGLGMAALTRAGGMTIEEVKELAGRAREDLKNKKIHAYCPVQVRPFMASLNFANCLHRVVVYGRKPL
jgi:hypothetical protein